MPFLQLYFFKKSIFLVFNLNFFLSNFSTFENLSKRFLKLKFFCFLLYFIEHCIFGGQNPFKVRLLAL